MGKAMAEQTEPRTWMLRCLERDGATTAFAIHGPDLGFTDSAEVIEKSAYDALRVDRDALRAVLELTGTFRDPDA